MVTGSQIDDQTYWFAALLSLGVITMPGSKTHAANSFPPLEDVTKPTVDTNAAAYYMNREAQTLRLWACQGVGVLTPLRINGRLAWPVPEMRKVLGVSK